jgi:hypothetical protein
VDASVEEDVDGRHEAGMTGVMFDRREQNPRTARYLVVGRNGAPMTPAEHTVALGERHVAEQDARIERQLRLIAELRADGHPDAVADAQALLHEMRAFAAQAAADLAAAKERVRMEQRASNAPGDDDKMDAVMRDCPM